MNEKQARLFFLALLVASLLLLLFVDLPGSPIGPNLVEKNRDTLTTILIVAQITAPVISAPGLLSTTYFSWRKDRREQQKQALELRSALSPDSPALPLSRKPNPQDSGETGAAGAAGMDGHTPFSI
jgi:hypothetical protein